MRPTRWVIVGLFVLAIPALGAGTAAAEEDFGAFVPEPQLEPGTEQTVTIDLQYRGDADGVTNTVGNISAALAADDPDELEVRTDQQYVTSSISSNATVSTSFTVVADDSLRDGADREDSSVDTTLTVYYDDDESTDVDITLQAEEQAYFTGERTDGELQIGEPGTIEYELENIGYESADDVTIDIEPAISGVDVLPPTERSLSDELDVGDSDAFSVDLEVTDETLAGDVPLRATVEFEDENGVTQQSRELLTTVPIADDQQFDVDVDESTLRYGETGTVDLDIENTGDELSDATVQVQSLSSAVTITGGQDEEYIGDWDTNDEHSVSVSGSTDDGTPIDDATFAVTVDYRDDGADRTSRAVLSGIDVASEQRFDADYGGDPLRVGETRTVPVELTNQDYGDISDAVVGFQVLSPDGELPEGASEVEIGNWNESESHTANVTVTVDDDAPSDNLPIRATVEYETEDGLDRESASVTVGAEVLPSQDFTVDIDEADLRVGESSTITGNITNTGDEELSHVILQPEEADIEDFSVGDVDNVEVQTDNYYIGTLDPGESASFALSIDVSGDAEPGPRAISLQTDYENPDGDRYTVSPLFVPFDVDPERDDFDVEIVDASVPIDSSETLTLEVTNQLDDDVTDVEAMLYTEDPLSSDDDQAFIDSLDANESATIDFTIDADSTAVEKTYPAEVDFQYEDSDGDTQLSDVYTVPVDVTAEERNWLQIALIFGILLVGGSAIALRYFDAVPSLRGS